MATVSYFPSETLLQRLSCSRRVASLLCRHYPVGPLRQRSLDYDAFARTQAPSCTEENASIKLPDQTLLNQILGGTDLTWHSRAARSHAGVGCPAMHNNPAGAQVKVGWKGGGLTAVQKLGKPCLRWSEQIVKSTTSYEGQSGKLILF